MNTARWKPLFTVFILGSFTSTCFADTVGELNKTLTKFSAKSPIQAELHSSFLDVFDGDKKQGEVRVNLVVNNAGFNTIYDTATLANMSREAVEKSRDEDKKSPTIDAAYKLNTVGMHRMLSAAESLQQFLYNAELIEERFVVEDGKSFKQLSFNIPMESLVRNKKTRQYVDDFESEYNLWLDENGIPVKSHLTFKGEGSAYVFFNLEAYGENTSQYQVVNDRLIEFQHSSKNGSKSVFGDFERNEQKVVKVLKSQSH
ncbi:MAG: hypothetical protein ACSHW0_16505 [Thalassotalea sp.]